MKYKYFEVCAGNLKIYKIVQFYIILSVTFYIFNFVKYIKIFLNKSL